MKRSDIVSFDTTTRNAVIDGFSASTHKMPLEVLCAYLGNSGDCEIAVIGIAAENLGL